jgi:4-diphosphocytidyl-2-C-methyl-D-erythritol kinase
MRIIKKCGVKNIHAPETVRQSLSARAYAKINLTLQILSKRSDSYHEIESLVQRISLHDIVTARLLSKGSEDRVICGPFGPARMEDNTAYKAICALRSLFSGDGVHDVMPQSKPKDDSCPALGPVEVRIRKEIPSGAGLGGASADAAATLMLLSRLWGIKTDSPALSRAASMVGSDVPVCLAGPLNVIRGRGERVSPVIPLDPFWIIVAFPEKSILTTDAYAHWDILHPELSAGKDDMDGDGGFYKEKANDRGAHLHAAMNAVACRDLRALGSSLRNDFNEVVAECVPITREIEIKMKERGALGASVTGSGSAVFGIWARQSEARQALSSLRMHFSDSGINYILAYSLNDFEGLETGAT